MLKFIGKNTKKYYPLLLLTAFLICLFFGVGKSFSESKIEDQEVKVINNIKFAQLTDVHFDSKSKDRHKRLLSHSVELFQDAINQMNNMQDLDLVVFSGDMINRPDEYDFLKFAKMANTLKYPWLASTGNHDIGIGGGMSKERFKVLMNSHNRNANLKNPYYLVEPKKGYAFIFLDGSSNMKITANGLFPKEQLEWLDKQLRKHKKDKVVIVQHFPVVEPFHSKSHEVVNAQDYLDVIDKHKNVVAVVSGHYHVAKIQNRNNVLHISTPSLVEYPNAFRVIEIKEIKQGKEKKIKVDYQLFETSLKDLQAKSRSNSTSYLLQYGSSKDRNGSEILEKN